MRQNVNLTKLSFLAASTSVSHYGVTILFGLIANPLILGLIGPYWFGIWKVCQRLLTYVSSIDGQSTQALKLKIGNKQHISDEDYKKKQVSSAVAVWFRFLPLLIFSGSVLAYFSPYFVNNVEHGDFFLIRLTSGILILNMVVSPLYSIPESVLVGMNSAHRTNLVNMLSVVVLNVLMISLSYLGYGILGLSISIIVASLVRGTLMFSLAKRMFDWFGLIKVEKKNVSEFFSFSIWVMGSAFVTKFMLSSDIVIIGMISSASNVTTYSMSIYAIQALVNVSVLLVTAGLPGLGGIIGKGELGKASKIRSEMLSYTWLAMAVSGVLIILWNKDFVSLWIGQDNYIGSLENLILVVSMAQLIFIRSEARIVDITLELRSKVLLGVASSGLSFLVAIGLGKAMENPLIGIMIGLMAGRCLISVSYPRISRLNLKIKSVDTSANLRRFIAMGSMYAFAFWISGHLHAGTWISLIIYSLLSAPIVFLLAFYFGFESSLRQKFIERLGQMVHRKPVAQASV